MKFLPLCAKLTYILICLRQSLGSSIVHICVRTQTPEEDQAAFQINTQSSSQKSHTHEHTHKHTSKSSLLEQQRVYKRRKSEERQPLFKKEKHMQVHLHYYSVQLYN